MARSGVIFVTLLLASMGKRAGEIPILCKTFLGLVYKCKDIWCIYLILYQNDKVNSSCMAILVQIKKLIMNISMERKAEGIFIMPVLLKV